MAAIPLGEPQWSLSPLHARFGAELQGHQLGDDDLPQALKLQIMTLVQRYGVVLIRRQELTDERLLELARLLGRPRDRSPVSGKEIGVFRLSNMDPSGRILPADDAFLRLNDANVLWHTDNTYFRPRASVSFLYSRVVPSMGGNTEFCDTRCAYEDLSEELRTRIAGRSGFHSLIQSRALVGFTDWAPEVRERLVSIERPLLQRHHESGRMALCIASHISKITGTESDADSATLLSDLIDAATQPGRIYSHAWQVGDLLAWDNRCTMHRARPYDQLRLKRDLRSIRLDDVEDAQATG